MEDSVDDVNRKIKKAYCPEKIVEKNPVMDYTKNIVMAYFGTLTLNIDGVSTYS
jgi:tyrosyl-tRNA synthetase